jgi:colanic acid/amylovoran biosynthesis glycosyltransferase
MPDPPVILAFCATFLPEESRHIYRQVNGLENFDCRVVCRRRANESLFPYDRVSRLHPPAYRFLWRSLYRIQGKRIPLTPHEVNELLRVRSAVSARLVHVYLGTEALRALPYLQKESCKKIVSFHGADLSDSITPEDIKRLDRCTDLFLCRCQALADALAAKGCPGEKIRIHYTGVPVPDVPAPDPPTPGKPLRLLQACRLIDKKGIDLSIRALGLLIQQQPARLTLAGAGPNEQALKRLVQELGLEAHVQFAGFLEPEKLQEELSRSHLVLHPSRTTDRGDREGIPNSLLEAMASAVPVISTRHSGIPEAIDDRVDGILVEESPESLRDGILEAVRDRSAWESLGQKARAKIINSFSREANIRSLEAIYRECL